jgi:hypothetical protein
VESRQVVLGDAFELPVRIVRNPAAFDQLEMRFTYQPDVLRFTGALATGLAASWTCATEPIAPDTVRVLIAGPTIPALSSGDLLTLRFEDLACPAVTPVTVRATGAELDSATTCGTTVSCAPCRTGDVNGDRTVTPEDARCTFEIFLGGGVVPTECATPGDTCALAAADPNCDGVITPSDALAILHGWATAPPPLPGCWTKPANAIPSGPGARAAVAATGVYRFDPVHAVVKGALVSVPLETRAATDSAAFGFDLHFDPETCEFVALRATGSTPAWQALDARLLAPGLLRVGGFAWHPLRGAEARTALAAWNACAMLEFRAPGGLGDFMVEWIESVPAGVEAVPVADWLSQPYPNPARGDVWFTLGAAPEARPPFVVRILDVRGHVVRTLHNPAAATREQSWRWDRSDQQGRQVAAGIYVAELRAGAHVERRKFVLLR